MKKRLLFLQVLFLLVLAPMAVNANDYLELQKHYSAYAAGADKIHFKIPVYSESEAGNSYYLYPSETRLWYSLDGVTSTTICYLGCNNKTEDERDSYVCGSGRIQLQHGMGVIEVTNICGGTRQVISSDNQTHDLSVTKVEESDNDDDNVTWLEFDWYPQEELAEKTFRVGIHAHIVRRGNSNPHSANYTKDWTLQTGLSGGQNMIQAQLYQPYFHTVDENGVSGYGNAAVPYMVFYDPKSYTTSLDPSTHVTENRSGTIIVPTTDTVQEQFYATFQVYRMKTPTEVMSTQVTTKVDIPPYHRIYDFSVEEETDKTGTFTGNNVLSRNIKNPNLSDLVDGDYFEVQRALNEDFSDAKQLMVVPMTKSDTSDNYTYLDESRDVWTGNAESQDETVSRYVKFSKEYIMYDEEGDEEYTIQ